MMEQSNTPHWLWYYDNGFDLNLLEGGTKREIKKFSRVGRNRARIESHEGNFGFCPGGRTVIVDVDVRDGRDGDAQLDSLPALPPTRVVRTPSGGRHIYLSLSDRVQLHATVPGCPHVQLLTGFSNVVAAGSKTVASDDSDAGVYQLEVDLPVAPCPAEWLMMIRKPERNSLVL